MKVSKRKQEKIGNDKCKIAAALLAFFLGTLGVHDFNLDDKKGGLIKLGLTVIISALMIVGFH